MGRKSAKQPKQKNQPDPKKIVIIAQEPKNNENKKPSWRFNFMDTKEPPFDGIAIDK